jgi:prevent-host-death family protein
MNRIIGVTELQRSFRVVFEQVAHNRMPYVLTRGSRPEAALIPYEDYLRFQQLQEKDVLGRLDRLTERMASRNEAYTEEEVEVDIRKARARGRKR